MVRKAGLNTVAGVVGQRQRNRTGGRDGAVVCEAATVLGDGFNQLGIFFRQLLHVTAVTGQKHFARHLIAQLVLLRQRGALGQQGRRHFRGLLHNRRRTLFFRQRQTFTPPGQCQLFGHLFGKGDRGWAAVGNGEHRQRRAQAQKAHAVPTFVFNFPPLLFQGQAIDLNHVIQHSGKYGHQLAKLLPVKLRLISERVYHALGQVDGTQQAASVGRQGLFAAGISGPNFFTEPVVIPIVNLVDKNEARLGKVVGGRHDLIPQLTCGNLFVHLAGYFALLVAHVVAFQVIEPAPDHFFAVIQGYRIPLLIACAQRERQLPGGVGFDRLNKIFGNQQRQVELAQATGLALGANKFADVRVMHVEGGHLCTAATACRGDGETHLVESIHERQRPRSSGPRARHVGAFGAQRGEFVADAAAGLQSKPRLDVFVQNILHGILNRAGYRAVDGGGGGLVFVSTSVSGDATGRYGAVFQRPENCLRQCAFCLGSSSARASATRSQVPLTVLSTLSPWWSLRRYFWSQMSQEASCSASNSKVGCWAGVSLLDLLIAEDSFV